MHDNTLTLTRQDALELPSLTVIAHTPTGDVRARLGLRPVIVGSADDCDLVVADPRVSRHHCRLSLGEYGIEVTDLNSKNGTYARDVAIVQARIAPGVAVTVGATRLTVQIDGAPTVVPLSMTASFGSAIGGSWAMRALFAQLLRAASTDAGVLLIGETGTGKALLARAIHQVSPRRDGPFEVLDCAGASAVAGALEDRDGALLAAHGGTLFVDEIGELPLELQRTLLRALETRQVKPLGGSEWRPFDARIVCATHHDLRAEISAGNFREDLFYRVATVEAAVPPLRERKQDLPLLVERFLAEQRPPQTLDELPPGAMSLLLAHDWPGNVRELRNTVARLSISPELRVDFDAGGEPGPQAAAVGSLPLREARALVVEYFERQYVARKLRQHGGNVSRAADAIGVSRQFLHRLMDRYDIRRAATLDVGLRATRAST